MDEEESHTNGTPTPRPGPSRSASNQHEMHISLSPTSDTSREGILYEFGSLPPFSTSATDALRTVYFPDSDGNTSAGPRRSLSNPDVSNFLTADISHGSRLADVSETDTMEDFTDLNRSRTQPRVKSRRKRKLDRNGSGRIMSMGEEEVPQDWTVFGELFQDNHAPIIGKKSIERGRKRSQTVTNTIGPQDAGAARSATSVIRHWRTVMAASRPHRQDEEQRGAPSGGESSSRPIDILSRGKSTKKNPVNASVGSPTSMLSPEMEHQRQSSIAPLRRVFDGDEDVLDHHRLSADYERSIQAQSRKTKSVKSLTSGSSDTSSDSDDEQSPTPPVSHNKFVSVFKRLRDEMPQLSTLQRNMLKCAIAYFLASLFTFVPFLSDFIADIGSFGKGAGDPSPSAHMIATV